MSEIDLFFVDANILVYAHQRQHDERANTARKILTDCFAGKSRLVISNQVLGEFCRVARHKLDNPIPDQEIAAIIQDISASPDWVVLNYTSTTVLSAMKADHPTFFWDGVIAQTMLENGITKIYTENVKDFSKIKGLKAVNPFK